MKHSSASHEFALYYESLSGQASPLGNLIITAKEMVHRIERVLRLKEGEQFILFNRERHAKLRITQMDRKQIVTEIISFDQNKIYSPDISFLLPVLKRDALSAAVYFLVEAGVNAIQLIQSKNQQRAWGGQKELERLERVCIAAAEQSKHFAIPPVLEPISYEQAVNNLPESGLRILANPDGVSFTDISSKGVPTQIILTCGPEADLSVEEKELLRVASFQSMRLTPTILRAETAAFCISSLFRSVFSNS
ncbi:RsmE family RNA methyltransferase [Candidatus Dependentiae bacterium]